MGEAGHGLNPIGHRLFCRNCGIQSVGKLTSLGYFLHCAAADVGNKGSRQRQRNETNSWWKRYEKEKHCPSIWSLIWSHFVIRGREENGTGRGRGPMTRFFPRQSSLRSLPASAHPPPIPPPDRKLVSIKAGTDSEKKLQAQDWRENHGP